MLGEIQEARSPEELSDSRAKLPVFVKALLESGARVESVTRIMTTVSDAILVRLIELAEADLGPPPVAFAFVVLGSEAREEQTLATDQDNAIIYADGDPERDRGGPGVFPAARRQGLRLAGSGRLPALQGGRDGLQPQVVPAPVARGGGTSPSA